VALKAQISSFIKMCPVGAEQTDGYTEAKSRFSQYAEQLSNITTSSALGDKWLTPRPGRFILGKEHGTNRTGNCVGPTAGLDHHRDSNPEPSSPIAIPTALPQLDVTYYAQEKTINIKHTGKTYASKEKYCCHLDKYGVKQREFN
jgi:hypothetical protein